MKNLKGFIIITLLFMVAPTFVSAASLKAGSTKRTNNVYEFPVVINVSTGEVIKQVTLSCSTTSGDAPCTIERSTTSSSVFQQDNTKTVIMASADTGFVNNQELAIVKVTSSLVDKATVSVNIKATVGDAPYEFRNDIQVASAITTAAIKSKDATLKSLSISQGKMTPAFQPNVYDYTIYGLADTINSIRVTPVCNVANRCDYDITGGKSVNGNTVTLDQGENNIIVSVVAEDGVTKASYKLKVFRGETNINSSKLASLSFGDYVLSPEFKKNTTEYTLSIPNGVSSLKDVMKYTLDDPNASVEVDGEDNLVVGTNTITIEITSADSESTTTYTIEVTRLDDEEITILKYINDEVTFIDADGVQTTLPIEEFKNQYPKYYNQIQNGELKFDKDGNLITEDEEEKEEKKSSKTWLIVVLIIVGLAIIGVSGFFLFRKKKPKKDKKGKDKKKKEALKEEKEEEQDDSVEENEEDEKEQTKEFDEYELEKSIIKKENESTEDIDDAINDLMHTKAYDFDYDDEEKED